MFWTWGDYLNVICVMRDILHEHCYMPLDVTLQESTKTISILIKRRKQKRTNKKNKTKKKKQQQKTHTHITKEIKKHWKNKEEKLRCGEEIGIFCQNIYRCLKS